MVIIWRYWNNLAPDLPCPIHFTEDELKQHLEDAKGRNEMQGFWGALSHIVMRDGWTHNEQYDDAVAIFKELRETA